MKALNFSHYSTLTFNWHSNFGWPKNSPQWSILKKWTIMFSANHEYTLLINLNVPYSKVTFVLFYGKRKNLEKKSYFFQLIVNFKSFILHTVHFRSIQVLVIKRPLAISYRSWELHYICFTCFYFPVFHKFLYILYFNALREIVLHVLTFLHWLPCMPGPCFGVAN